MIGWLNILMTTDQLLPNDSTNRISESRRYTATEIKSVNLSVRSSRNVKSNLIKSSSIFMWINFTYCDSLYICASGGADGRFSKCLAIGCWDNKSKTSPDRLGSSKILSIFSRWSACGHFLRSLVKSPANSLRMFGSNFTTFVFLSGVAKITHAVNPVHVEPGAPSSLATEKLSIM